MGGLTRSGDSEQWTSPPTAVGLVVTTPERWPAVHPEAVPVARAVALLLLAVLLVVLWWRAWTGAARLNDVRQRVLRRVARPRVTLHGAALALAATVACSPGLSPLVRDLAAGAARAAATRTTWFVLPAAVAAFLTLPDGTNLARFTKAPGAVAMTALLLFVLLRVLRASPHRAGCAPRGQPR